MHKILTNAATFSDESLKITIPLKRFEQLIDTETRVNVLVDYIVNNGYCDMEKILRTLGTELAIEKAEEIAESKKMMLQVEHNDNRANL